MERWIELRHLRYVIAAAEQGSFRRAADVIGVQVSAMSRSIRGLEDKIGVGLFIRSSQGVKPTFAGEHFLGCARRVMVEIDKAIREAESAGTARHGVVRIGLLSSLATGFLATLIRIYRVVYPNVTLTYVEGAAVDHVLAVRQHRLDIAFLFSPIPADGCDSLTLWSERIFVAMAREDGLAGREAVEWTELRKRRFIFTEAPLGPEIRDYLTEQLAGLGLFPKMELIAVYRDTLMQIVAAGSDLTVVGEARAAAQVWGVVFRSIAGGEFSFRAVWLPMNDNPAFRRFLSLAKLLSKRCSLCVFKDGLTGSSDEKDGVADGLDEGRLSRLSRIVSKTCAACLLKHLAID